MSAAVEFVSRDAEPLGEQIDQIDWSRVAQELDARGNALVEGLLSPDQCRTLAGLYQADTGFSNRESMESGARKRGAISD
jgi:uncharacterized protein